MGVYCEWAVQTETFLQALDEWLHSQRKMFKDVKLEPAFKSFHLQTNLIDSKDFKR